MDTLTSHGSESRFHPRAYQLEMLEESLKKNVIVAMDTGSGKTNMHVLLDTPCYSLKMCLTQFKELFYGSQLSSSALVWFLCPTVALAEQQYNVLSVQLPSFPSRLLSGNDGIDRWSEQGMWDDALRNINIVVCTHQVLLDALIHGFVHMHEISLLVFDEAHHCARGHPANKIMQNFYHAARYEGQGKLPSILGLTASPVVRRKGEGLQMIEQNLNAISKTPKINREELRRYVHEPEMSILIHPDEGAPYPRLVQDLSQLYFQLDVEQDPYVARLRSEDSRKYHEVRVTRKTYCQDQLKRLVRMADEVHNDLGPWTSELYVCLCIYRLQAQRQAAVNVLQDMNESERTYLTNLFTSLRPPAIDIHLKMQDLVLSPKAYQLTDLLAKEMRPGSAGIVFVKTRAAVKLLSVLLTTHPVTKHILRVGTFVGTSNHYARASNISDLITISDQQETLNDLRSGTKNLIIATSVCEEGIDIAACNIVVCFEAPPNLKSFIQRRGRARSIKSKYVIMFSEGQEKSLLEWRKLEEEMKEKYMDDMRQLEETKSLEAEEHGYREFSVEATGAKITLQDAVQHLYHFCNTLPATPYTVLAPTFTFDDTVNGTISCRMILPNSVDSTAREFRSTGSWRTERWARMDAAFEAYVGLYRVGLINNNLLPLPTYDEEAAKAYAKVAKRPPVTLVNAKFNPWPAIAAAWRSTLTLYIYVVTILSGDTEFIRMKMTSPCRLPQISSFTIYVNAKTSLQVKIGEGVEMVKDEIRVATSNEITRILFISVFPTRVKEDDQTFLLLFEPYEDLDDPQSWLDHVRGMYDCDDILLGATDPAAIGLIRDHSKSDKAYVFHAIERMEQGSSEQPMGRKTNVCLKVKKFPKRTDFLHRIPANAAEKKDDFVFLDPNDCRVGRLPVIYSQFAMYIPAIMHHVENALSVNHLCNGLLAPVRFSSPAEIFPAICAPAAREDDDYQRLEFLGDSILKMLTSIGLMADHQTWHEGYLSRAKDHIVSNGRLAMAAQEAALDKYILTQPFTGKKWKPLTSARFEKSETSQQRKMSTKTLADVVEALFGAAFLNGGFPMALSCLKVLLPEASWLPLAERNNMLLRTVCGTSQSLTIPSDLTSLETLLGHTFTHKLTLLEAVTHPSHFSIPSTPSYQRLEYLGDALLDYLVTTTIFSHEDTSQTALQPYRMHTLRVTAVNASFLAFCSLSRAVSTPVMEIATPDPKKAPSLIPGARSTSLPQFLRHAPVAALTTALHATRARFTALEPMFHAAFGHGLVYPWRALAAFAPEKVFSDLVEAVLGAVYVDTNGDLKACMAMLRRFGVLEWVEMALKNNVEIRHPKEEVGRLAGNEKVRYHVWTVDRDDYDARPMEQLVDAGQEKLALEKGRYWCKLSIGGSEICCVQGWNRIHVETAAAEEAIQIVTGNGSSGNVIAPDPENGPRILKWPLET